MALTYAVADWLRLVKTGLSHCGIPPILPAYLREPICIAERIFVMFPPANILKTPPELRVLGSHCPSG